LHSLNRNVHLFSFFAWDFVALLLSQYMKGEIMEQISFDIIVKVLTGTADPGEEKVFKTWIDSSDEHQSYYRQFELILRQSGEAEKYSRLNMQKAWMKIAEKAALPLEGQNNKRKFLKRGITRVLIRAAAIFILAYGLGGTTFYLLTRNKQTPREEAKYYSISAPLGSKSKIVLPDSSIVWLNSGSELKYPGAFENDRREVLLSGEAYFDVSKNQEAPFYVSVHEIKVKVLGTKFNIKSYPDESTIETTLEEGLVHIGKAGSSRNILLKPHQRAVFVRKYGETNASGSGDGELRKVGLVDHIEQFFIFEEADTDLYTSWKDNRLKFRSKSFEDMAVELERWFGVKIHIENEGIKSKVFTGSFDKENIEQVIKALKVTIKFDYEIDKNNVWIK